MRQAEQENRGLAAAFPAGGGPRILVAEDEPEMRDLVTGLVEALGYDAVPVPDGEAALAAVAAGAPDLVLSDVNMPGLSGFEVCRRLKADPSTRLIPVVLITGIRDEHKIEGIEAGADDYLRKPFSLEELRARIRSLLRMKAFLDELEHAEAVLCALGRALGLPEADLIVLRRGGYLHDLGKIGVPDAILNKPARLTLEERAVMQRHPALGEEICRPLRSLQGVLPIIRHHHERADGSGYPDGLCGEAIPPTARILQVVDVYDALTTERPYRRSVPPAAALEVLEEEARRDWWDLRLVRAFGEIVNGGGRV